MKLHWFLIWLAAPALALAQDAVTLHHVHGLAYSGDGQRIIIPSHHGLAVYENGRWSKAPGPEHDYMGFVATAKNFYSSGHPAPRSGLRNPFGLIRSRDGGRTWDKLGLEGETDFHLLAAGWNTNAIYVWNPEPSSRMRATGLHFTLNEGFSWQRAAVNGLTGEPRSLAVHPDDRSIVAVATSQGLYLSRNAGEQFERIARNGQGLAVYFDLDGIHLWYSAHGSGPTLSRLSIRDAVSASVPLPPLTNDAVGYIAQNPIRRREYVVATFERSVYLSKDGGKTWSPIAVHGAGK
jgi:hypothetical protein